MSPQLGAHALVKLLNADGEDLGACVICLTDLMTRNLDVPKGTGFKMVRVQMCMSVGKQKRIYMSFDATFLLCFCLFTNSLHLM